MRFLQKLREHFTEIILCKTWFFPDSQGGGSWPSPPKIKFVWPNLTYLIRSYRLTNFQCSRLAWLWQGPATVTIWSGGPANSVTNILFASRSHTHIHTHSHTFTHTHTYIYIYIYSHTHTHTHAHKHLCIACSCFFQWKRYIYIYIYTY